MEPRIQYAQTSDGVSIAFLTMGEGTALVQVPALLTSTVQGVVHLPGWRRWNEHLGRTRMLVRYDARGGGLSGGGRTDPSLDSLVLDLEAVVDHLDLEMFDLMGIGALGPVAIAYAARHTQRVSHLLLWGTSPRGSIFRPARWDALFKLADEDWELFTQTIAHELVGWSEGDDASGLAAIIRESQTPDSIRRALTVPAEFDVTALLPLISLPTLVFQRRQAQRPEISVARELASGIAGARLVLLEGTMAVPYVGDTAAVLQAIDDFLGEGEPLTHPEPIDLPSGTAVILFADIADSTALTERMGDAAFRSKAREIGVSLRALIRECGGTPVEGPTLGDGVLAAFTSAREAIEAAVRCRDEGSREGLPLHVGVHAGDVMREKDPDGRANVYGGAVNIAARIAGASAAGEILVSDTVRSLARTSSGVTFEDRGERELKGVADPQRLFAVQEGGPDGRV